MDCLNRFLPGGLAPEWDGLGQVARQHASPPVGHSTKRVNCAPPASHLLQKEPCLRHAWVRSETRTPARSESYSEVHGKCNSVGRRRAYRPIETDWQVCLDEVSFEQAVVMLDGPAFINQGRKSHRGVIYDERRS